MCVFFFWSLLFLEHYSTSCFVNFLCLFWLGWHMFLLSGRSKSTCVVHVGGAAWLYYFCRIVHLDFVFRPRKLHILFIYCPFTFSRWRWIYLCAHGIDLLGPAGDNPMQTGQVWENVRNLMSPVSAEEPSGTFRNTPTLLLFYLFY